MEQEQEKGVDVAREPVDLSNKDEFTDTGVLYEDRPCSNCGEKPAAKGSTYCAECATKASES